MTSIRRRTFLQLGAAALSAAGLSAPRIARAAAPRVVVIGGGFGGATAARAIRMTDPGIAVTLVERDREFQTCPFSNLVLGGLRDMDSITRRYDTLAARHGIGMVHDEAVGVDAGQRTVTLKGGDRLAYDRLVIAPGIDIRWGALEGYDEAAAEHMPHAWKAGPQTMLLRRQLEAMEDGGTVIMVAPDNPFRCPPGPYERASMIAHYLKNHKPRSKILILDAKDQFSKQTLFENGWSAVYPEMIQWVSKSTGGVVSRVDPAAMTVETEFGLEKGHVINVIPPQKAGRIAELAGVTDDKGWCPIDPVSFESARVPGIHVIGDSAIAAPMPKSATAASGQARVAAYAIVARLRGREPDHPSYANTCYSLIAPDYGISVTGVYEPTSEGLKEIAGGVSALDASAEDRLREARYADAWYRGVTRDAFG